MAAGDLPPILRVLRGLLRPLVRLLIAHGVTAPNLYRMLKRVYVEVAYDEFRIGEGPPTDSRVSLLTGVHRRDVRDILGEDGEEWESARAKTAAFATVLGQWMGRQDLTGADGRPRPLPRSGAPGADFESLVQSVSRDIRPRTILDELLRQNLVVEGADGLLRVAESALAGPGSSEDRIVFFAANVGDHLSAAAENLLADTPPHFERAVFYTRLSEASVDRIEARARALGQAALEEINRESAELQAGDRMQGDARSRYRFGLYFFRETGEGSSGNGSSGNGSSGDGSSGDGSSNRSSGGDARPAPKPEDPKE